MKYRRDSILSDEPPGVVALIKDTGDFGRLYALKVFEREGPEDDAAIAAARASWEASDKLNHPALLAYHDFRLKKSWFRTAGAELLMEYVDGRSLDELQGVSVGQWAMIFREVAAALAHMHRRKVLHGGLTPARVMVTRGGRVKVLGYGLSLVEAGRRPEGPKAYLAPEQVKEGALTERTEVYNLGAVLYRCLTGQSANVGKRAEGEAERISKPSALNPKVPGSLNNLVVSCLQLQPGKRPESLYDVKERLDAIVAELNLDPDALAGLGAAAEA